MSQGNEEIAKECAFYTDEDKLTQRHSLASTILNIKEALDKKGSEAVKLKEQLEQANSRIKELESQNRTLSAAYEGGLVAVKMLVNYCKEFDKHQTERS